MTTAQTPGLPAAKRGDPMATTREPVRLALRKLWSDHVIWTREYIVAAVAGTPDAGAAATRLLGNQEDIGAAVAGFYGQAAGDRLTELLKEHILIAVDLVAAAKSGRPGSIRDARRALDGQHRDDRRVPRRRQPELAREGRPRPAGAPSQADQGRGCRPDHRRLGRRRQGVRRHLHRDHGPRRRPPRRDRGAVPGALRRDGDGVTALDLAEASPDRATLPIGAAGPPFDGLLGTDGRRHGLSDHGDRAAIVLVFSSNRCPTAKAYAERMNALQEDYGPRGVQLLAINSNDPHLYPDESYRADGRARCRGPISVPVRGRRGPAGREGVRRDLHVPRLRARRATDASATRAGSTTRGCRPESRATTSGTRWTICSRTATSELPTTRPFGCSLDLV